MAVSELWMREQSKKSDKAALAGPAYEGAQSGLTQYLHGLRGHVRLYSVSWLLLILMLAGAGQGGAAERGQEASI